MRALIGGLFLTAVIVGWRAGGTGRPAAGDDAVSLTPQTRDDRGTPRQSGGTIDIARGEAGHFFVTGDVAGKSLRFIVDTGATTVAIGRDDARRLGYDLPDAAFDVQMGTASGTVGAARITLPRLRIGDIQLLGVSASVINVPAAMPLLGQSFLSRLDRVSIENDRMTLAKR